MTSLSLNTQSNSMEQISMKRLRSFESRTQPSRKPNAHDSALQIKKPFESPFVWSKPFTKIRCLKIGPCSMSKAVESAKRFYPIDRVGLYIPGGNVPLVSTVVMTATLAQLVGCPEVIVCTPPAKRRFDSTSYARHPLNNWN